MSSFNLIEAKRILVLKLDEIGDFILATPFLRALRLAAPNAFIALAATGPVVPLTQGCPHIDCVATPVGDVMGGKFSFRGRTPQDLHAFADAFRAGFDVVINARFDFDKGGAATVAAATKAPTRLAYSEKVTPWKADGNRGFDAAYTRTLRPPGVAHEVERNLDLIRALGGAVPAAPAVELYLTDDEIAAGRAVIKKSAAAGGAVRALVVAPTTNIPRKNYPLAAFADLLARVVEANRFEIVVFLGTHDGAARASALALAVPCAVLDLTGRTTVREAAAIVAAGDAMLAADTGPAHMAAALGVPVAALFCQPLGGDPLGPHAPERFRPWGRDALVIQPEKPNPPCVDKCLSDTSHCIAQIDPAEAAARIAGFFAKTMR